MTTSKIFGIVLTILGIFLLLFAGYAVLNDGGNLLGMGLSTWEAAVPFILGIIFFASGIRLIKTSDVK